MKELKLKEFEVKDGRVIAKFLKTTGLKKTLFDVMFPKDNPNMPKNWLEMRKHLQDVYEMSDKDFMALKKEYEGNFNAVLAKYASDFPDNGSAIGEILIETIIDLFAEDENYDATIALLAHLYVVDKAIIEAMSFQEIVELVKKVFKDSGFLELWLPSTPLTGTAVEEPKSN